MTITLSPALVWFCVHVIGWALAVTMFLVLVYASACFLIRVLKRRRVYGVARVFLTTRMNRARAEEYTYFTFYQVAKILKKENPPLFRRVRELFECEGDQ